MLKRQRDTVSAQTQSTQQTRINNTPAFTDLNSRDFKLGEQWMMCVRWDPTDVRQTNRQGVCVCLCVLWPAKNMRLLPGGLLSLMQEHSFDVGVLPWAQCRSGNRDFGASWTFPYIELACFRPLHTLKQQTPWGWFASTLVSSLYWHDRRGLLQITSPSYSINPQQKEE